MHIRRVVFGLVVMFGSTKWCGEDLFKGKDYQNTVGMLSYRYVILGIQEMDSTNTEKQQQMVPLELKPSFQYDNRCKHQKLQPSHP